MKLSTDRQVKKFLVLTGFTLLIAMLLTQLFSYRNANRIKSEMLEHDYEIAGSLIQQYPELASGIRDAFSSDKTPAKLEAGKSLLEPIDYKSSTQFVFIPRLYQSYQTDRAVHFLLSVLLSIAMLLEIRWFLKKHYQKLDSFSAGIQRMMNGENQTRLDDRDEGSLSKLAASVNIVTSSLYSHVEKEKQSRIFLKDLLMNISHQLKTPISALAMYNEIMQEENENNEVVTGFLKKSENELNRMQTLTANLLKLAKLDAGVIELTQGEYSLNALILDLSENFETRFKKEQKTLEFIANQDITYYCDREWLLEAMSNLLKNALEHTDAGCYIRISLEETPLFIKIRVEDNGQGIHPEDLPFVFQRFYRSRFSQNKQGTGIGLTLTKTVIEMHGGLIDVESTPGKGTAFSVRLPILHNRKINNIQGTGI